MSSASSIRQRIHEQHAERQEQDRATQAAERAAEQAGDEVRRPVSVSGGHLDLTVVCSDGAVFESRLKHENWDEENRIVGWDPLPPIPGTPADDEEDGAR